MRPYEAALPSLHGAGLILQCMTLLPLIVGTRHAPNLKTPFCWMLWYSGERGKRSKAAAASEQIYDAIISFSNQPPIKFGLPSA